MAGKIPYINNGEVGSISNNKVGSYGSAISATESEKFPLTPNEAMRPTTTENNQYIMKAGNNNEAPEGSKYILDTSQSRSFYTGDLDPFKDGLTAVINRLNTSLNIMDDGYASTTTAFNELCAKKYNRFKLPNYNEILSRGFPHVFFVRPSCNIMSGNSLVKELSYEVNGRDNSTYDTFQYAYMHSPEILKELCMNVSGRDNDFMMSLSNRALSFSANDEAIETGEYGNTYTGYKIAYAKNDVKSKTAGSFSVTLRDDRRSFIYQIIRCWVEYASGVYRGDLTPAKSSIIDKILDYAGACYYIITAEDGETILFWSKYYGVFPTSIPATQYSWAAGNTLFNPELNVEFAYSFKRDFSPRIIAEFNRNARITDKEVSYAATYDPNNVVGAKTWVGSPFIETVGGLNGRPFELKLRFRDS